MSFNKAKHVWGVAIGASVVGAILVGAAFAQSPPPGGGPSPAERAIEYRQAVYTLIGGNFGPIAGMVQGRVPFNGADALKRAQRLASLATFLDDAFPEISKEGKTKAKPEIWTDRAEFDNIVSDLGKDTAALAATLSKDNSSVTPEFKAAVATLGNDCKTCHDKFRAK
jgi:cytochrome c556